MSDLNDLKSRYIKTFFRNFFFLGMVCFVMFINCERANAYIELPRDDEGWTIFTPSDDTRIMYVSADGNDDTGEVYTVSNHPNWENPQNPAATVNAFATYKAAFANTRNEYPDWVLFKRGDTFYETIGNNIRIGRSSTEPFLVGAYGDGGLSPILKIGSSQGIRLYRSSQYTKGTAEYIAFQGLRFYAHTRNPNDPEYTGSNGSDGLWLYTSFIDNAIKDVLVEGCGFLYATGNALQANGVAGSIHDIELRRNIFANNYNDYEGGGGHSQGIFSSSIDRMILEENIFDHNGWLIESYDGTKADGQATMFNHNIYFGNANNTILRKNIFMRPSSSHTKFTASEGSANVVLDNNLHVNGEIGLSMGGNYPDNEFRFVNPIIKNNVYMGIGRDNPRGSDLGWIFWTQGWDGGEIYNNLSVHNMVSVSNVFEFSVADQSRNVDIYDNVFLTTQNSGRGFKFNFPGTSSGITIRNNYLEMPGSGNKLIGFDVPMTGFTFSGNQYYDPESPGFVIQGTEYDYIEWQTEYEPDATFAKRVFADESRTLATYQSSIGETASTEAFIASVVAQDRYDWDARYEAEVVNDWIREGFFTIESSEDYRFDVDNSGDVSSKDALLILRKALYISMTGTAWQPSSTTGDVNCDGIVNTADALLILRHSLGLDMSGTEWCG